MNQHTSDVFKHYNLPFETYFTKGVNDIHQTHDELELVWVLRGRAELTVDGKLYVLSDQTLFMINPYQIHSIHSSEDSIIITYRFKKEFMGDYLTNYQGLSFTNKVQTLDELVQKYKEVPLLISQLIRLLIAPNQSALIRYKIIGYYNMLVYELYTMLLKEKYLDVKKKDVPLHIERQNLIVDYLNKNFYKKISLKELAQKVGISDYRLSHLMKEMFGISFREYLFNIRFEYALRLLRETEVSVLEIAKMSGFSDVKYLNKLLKERFKTTALKYRKRFTRNVLNREEEESFLKEFFTELRVCLRKLESKNIGSNILY